MIDLVIRNGTLIDGSGSPAISGDIGINGRKIVAVGAVESRGFREIDASGLMVCPGFIDGHTHFDAQVLWDPTGSSSSLHGVTTAVMGNCGFSLAPVSPETKHLVESTLERAEDISRDALESGLDWSWRTFSEYLGCVDRAPKSINYAANLGHSALRLWTMGERAFDEAATEEDGRAMADVLREALTSGAIGFTTSRHTSHTTLDGRPVPSRAADWTELQYLAQEVAASGRIFQVARKPPGSEEEALEDEIASNLRKLATTSRVALMWDTVTCAELAALDRITELGGRCVGQTLSRPLSALATFKLSLPFDGLPEWKSIRALSIEDQEVALRTPEVRRALVHAARHGTYGIDANDIRANKVADKAVKAAAGPDYSRLLIMNAATPPYESVGQVAQRRNIDPVELIIDLALETHLNQVFIQQLNPVLSDADLLKLMRHPRTVIALSDAGAHLGQISDYSLPTHLLAYWVRQHEELTWSEGIEMLTARPARLWGLPYKGLLREGYDADVNLFDPKTVAPELPTVVADFPGGTRRFYQEAQGIAATIVGGKIIYEDGIFTGALPGRLLSGQFSPPTF